VKSGDIIEQICLSKAGGKQCIVKAVISMKSHVMDMDVSLQTRVQTHCTVKHKSKLQIK